MGNFVCIDCGYKFDSSEKHPKTCPYCAGSSIEKEKSAEELVDTIKAE